MDLQSSAYTYIALSQLQQGKTANARRLLLKAVELDPEYSNNTAREELSGLH
jgi:Tfp pilus assembly protein PilF